ncbi:MAG: Transcriptional regulator, TrmB [Parcubacteria group bacterium]|nr:Transcriptional regulator, TrmB [Parcubacteria group bacterium]MDB5245118.1 Transcriptional regulator, TrmB [Parcubacteria group bacterium]
MQNRASLQKMLTQAGLSDHESAVYLAMLELGSTTILKLARQSGVKRTTIYHVIESLKAKGLVSMEERGFKQFPVAENPSRLERMLDEQKNALKSFFPELEALYSLRGNDSIIRYHSGVEAMRSAYDELLRDLRGGDEYCVIGDPERWSHFDKSYFKTFIEKRLRIDLKAKVILVASETAEAYKKTEKNYREEVRILPAGTTIDANMAIAPRKIVIHPLTHPVTTIVIETAAVVQMQKNLFKVIWDSLPS